MARLLVTGVTGQVGSYLAEIAIAEGHAIVGVGGPRSTRPLPAGVIAARGSWTSEGIAELLGANGVLDAVVLLGANTDLPSSWKDPAGTFVSNGLLVAIAAYELAAGARTRLVHASSSNVFGYVTTEVQDESAPIAPVSPYGVAKAAGQLAVTNARDGLGAPMSNLVYFMAASPRSSPNLVLRKITRGVAAVVAGRATKLRLGTMHVVRDICHARDFATAAILLAVGHGNGPPAAGDYACASGTGRSIRQMAEIACALSQLDAVDVLEEDTSYARPNDIQSLVGDASKLRALGWEPRTPFVELVRECLAHDLAALRAE
jgi:GDPmannose 4,6-dehydratase